MIPRRDIAAAEHIIDSSGAVEILINGYRTGRRGRPPARSAIRLMLIGLFLAIAHRGRGTFTAALEVLLTAIPDDEALRLGAKKEVHTDTGVELRPAITINTFYGAELAIDKGLTYGPNAPADLDESERDRRRRVVRSFCDALCDVFDFDLQISAAALDATSLAAWGRPFGKSTSDEDARATDGDKDARRVGRRDLDAAHGHQTQTVNAASDKFFGYHQHALVAVPGAGQAPEDVPALVLRLAITPANADVVDVSFDLIDSLRAPITDLLVDRHYHYKELNRWKVPLVQRGIRQHHDLHPNEQGFTEAGRLRWAAGAAHCPATPDDLGILHRPGPTALDKEKADFARRIAQRQQYAFVRHTTPDAEGKHRAMCPAEAGSIGCALRKRTKDTAVVLGLASVKNPPDPARDGEPLPECCDNGTVTITPPPSQLKIMQPTYWGSPEWEARYGLRSRAEGYFGNLKNCSTENVRRGHLQKNGLVWTHIIAALSAASYNLRIARRWNARRPPSGQLEHLLLAEVDAPLRCEANL